MIHDNVALRQYNTSNFHDYLKREIKNIIHWSGIYIESWKIRSCNYTNLIKIRPAQHQLTMRLKVETKDQKILHHEALISSVTNKATYLHCHYQVTHFRLQLYSHIFSFKARKDENHDDFKFEIDASTIEHANKD